MGKEEVVWGDLDWGDSAGEAESAPPPAPPVIPPPLEELPPPVATVLPMPAPAVPPSAPAVAPAPAPSPSRPPAPAAAPLHAAAKELQRGQRLPLSALGLGSSFAVAVSLQPSRPIIIDVSCLGLDLQDRLSDDRYFVFFNQKQSPCGSIRLGGSSPGVLASLDFSLASLPPQIGRLIVVATIDGQGRMGEMNGGTVTLQAEGQTMARFPLRGADYGQEKALMLLEFYRKGPEWRLWATGQGYAGGLAMLLEQHGAKVQ